MPACELQDGAVTVVLLQSRMSFVPEINSLVWLPAAILISAPGARNTPEVLALPM